MHVYARIFSYLPVEQSLAVLLHLDRRFRTEFLRQNHFFFTGFLAKFNLEPRHYQNNVVPSVQELIALARTSFIAVEQQLRKGQNSAWQYYTQHRADLVKYFT